MKDRNLLKVVKYYKDFNKEEILTEGMGVEIQDFTDPNISEEDINLIKNFYKEEFKDMDCIKSMHGPFIDLNPSSPDFDIRKVSFNKYLRALKIAEELSMDYIIFHSQIKEEHIQPGMEEYLVSSNKKLWKKLMGCVPNFRGQIAIENIFEKGPEKLKLLIDGVNLDNVGINLDIGHAKLGGIGLEEWFKTLKDKIIYIHIHSNGGKFDDHIPPSKEEVEYLYHIIDKYGLNPILSLEYEIKNLGEELKKYR